MAGSSNLNSHFREALIETVPCSVFIVDKNRKIIFWSKSAEQLTGFSAEEILGSTCYKLRMNICASKDPEIRKTFCPLESGNEGAEVECEMIRKDGSTIPVMRRSKPVYDDSGQMIGAIEALIDVSLIKQARTEISILKHEIARRGSFGQLVGGSARMQKLYETIKVVSQTDANVVVEGDTGTGKELIAKTIHNESLRSKGIFLAVNCGALPESLLEAELFGHAKGAFTGAVQTRTGCFEAAGGGTLFLDEIGEMPLTSQVKILRAIQEKEITRVGETAPRKIDVRIIAASNRNLYKMVQEGTFREDLYYRLNVVNLRVPSLSERREDIPDLVTHFIHQFNSEYGRNIEGCSPSAMENLLSRDWPGNVRELKHSIEHAFAVSLKGQKTITVESLPAVKTKSMDFEQEQTSLPSDPKTELLEALKKTDGNKTKAAKLLGITRAGLYKRMKRFGIDAG
ncbi:sigma-54 interaction domain-containing protein [Sedimentisphaera salicampi]|uniref:sigma-54 interaction domain-containing protein n=1 Tax=Sedimentisphaera salicampi TaxID=1941349 RepID=UPI000B9B7C8C|nr:sigma 54-interacting transcriptional regulator [Sedimentisphaera salicampi]OXU14374.1 Transcriptional regulatory protein ZraR [Sedimentisphaera salicampi]